MISKGKASICTGRKQWWPQKQGGRHTFRHAANSGFTLVEMLVALLLTAMMSALMIGGIRQIHAFTQLEKRQAAQAELDAVADHMASELASALPLPLGDHDGDGFVPMIGKADSVRFIAAVRTGLSDKALREVSYSIQRKDNKTILLREIKTYSRFESSISPYAVLDEIYTGNMSLSYAFSEGNSDAKTSWVDVWSSSHFPQSVRLKVSLIVRGVEFLSERTISISE